MAVKPKLRLDAFLPYRLSVASNAVSDRIAETYRRRFGLKVAEWRLLAILAEHERLIPAALGAITRMDKISVSRAAAALIGRELVAREQHPGDGRSHYLALSAGGRALYDEIAPAALAAEAELFGQFTLEERRLLDTMLRRIEAAVTSDD